MIKRVNNISQLENKIQSYKNADIERINIEDVKDIRDIKINKKKSSIERILDFLRSTENPYVIKVNGVIVKMEFTDNTSITASSCINKVLRDLYIKNC